MKIIHNTIISLVRRSLDKSRAIYTSKIFNTIFNRYNFTKVVIIFVVGLSSRILVNHIYNVNVYLDYFNYVSLTYYIIFSLFIAISHELVNYFEFSLIPSYFNIHQGFVKLKASLFSFICEGLSSLNKTLLSMKIGNQHTLASIIKNMDLYLKNKKYVTRFVKSYYNYSTYN